MCCAGKTSAILVASDAEAADKTARQLHSAKYGLVWTQFNDLSSFYYDRYGTILSAGYRTHPVCL